MAINFTIGDLTLDQTVGTQSPSDGNDLALKLINVSGTDQIDGFGPTPDALDTGFETYLSTLGLLADDKAFAALVEGADSNSTFISATADSGEKISDLRLVQNGSSNLLTSIQTLDGLSLYLHIDASGNYASVTTSATTGGRIVAAFALTDEVISSDGLSATAGIQFVTFEAIKQTTTTSIDEPISFSDVLGVGATATVSFNFQQLDAGNFLWAAVGDGSSAMLITGQDLNVKDTGGPSKIGVIEKGGADPSDAVNTSKATATTIGINAQHFAPTNTGDGATGVFTFVSGYDKLQQATPQYTGQNVKEIQYDDYLNVSSASVFISQLTGSGNAQIHFSLWEAGGDGTDSAPADLQPEVGYSAPGANNPYSYIGEQDSTGSDANLYDDVAVDVARVEITRGGTTYTFTGTGGTDGGFTVGIDGNDVTVDGVQANDSIKLIAADTSSTVDGTFNRIEIQALEGSAAFDIGHIDLSETAGGSDGLGSHAIVDDDGPSTFNPVDITYDPNNAANNVKNQAGQSKLNVDLSDAAGKTLSDLVGTDGFKTTDPLIFYDSDTTNNLLQGKIGSATTATNLTSGGLPIYVYGYGTSTLTASTDSNSADGLDSTKTVFTIGLDAAGDNYDFNMYGHIDNGSVNAFLDFAGQKQTIYDWLTLDLPTQLEATPPSPDDGDILFTGVQRESVSDFGDDFLYRAGVNNTAINVSSKGIGVGSQSITVGKGVFIDFIDGAPRTLDGQAPIGDLDFTGHTLVDDSGFGISQLKPNSGTATDVRVSVYKEDAANDPSNDGSYAPADITDNQLVNIDSITIQQISTSGTVLNSITVLAGVEADRALGGRTLSFDWGGSGDDDWVTITNLGTNYRVLVNGEESYNQMLVENVGTGNEGFDVSGIVYHQSNAGDPVHMDFDVRLFDGDLDPTVASLGVTLAPPDLL